MVWRGVAWRDVVWHRVVKGAGGEMRRKDVRVSQGLLRTCRFWTGEEGGGGAGCFLLAMDLHVSGEFLLP